MTRLSAAVFAALVAATVGAFFVTQRLKQAPTVVQSVARSPRFFSPNGDGVRDAVRISFRLKRADDVSVAIVDRGGEVVRRLVRQRPLRAYRRLEIAWNGRTDEGDRARDGLYRARIGLRRQGRSVTVPASFTLDATPPRPVVTSTSPVIFPARGAGSITVRFRGSTRAAPRFLVYRTDRPGRPRVAEFIGRAGSPTATWDGRLADGRKARPGTYLVAVEVRDAAGNVGTGPARLPPRPGEVQGHPGVTVRFIGISPPVEPVLAGARTEFLVDARARRYRWSIRRVGGRRPVARGAARSGPLRVRAPRGASGVYLLEARSGLHRTRVPFAVQARRRSPVLVVLPAITWLGRNPVDDDGRLLDGIPNTLDLVTPVLRRRVFAGGGLPAGFAAHEAPLLVWLDRTRLRYDLTTDLALAAGTGPRLEGRAGALLAGDSRWLPPDLQRRLRAFVQRGGRVASLGIDSLRRGVRLAPRSLRDPTAATPTDLYGARLKPLAALAPDAPPLISFRNGVDGIDLFSRTGGELRGFRAMEETAALGAGGRLLAAAGVDATRPVLVAYRLGRGVVIRFGLPEWTQRLADPTAPEVAQITRNTWTLLSRSR